ncbi:MAG: RNA-binding S4 domain-containing protein [Bacteroidota bacterium]|nr:RNA-binding S4 domain-containing protein [Bacteroidota bacterium]MDP4275789.1 RNA-binding S4 domain-containing protein [Bacteroidota bacterium]
MSDIRIDKWLWAVRIFKTRSIATEECKKNRVLVNNVIAKPAHIIKLNDIIMVRKPPVIYTFRVKGLLENRVSAKLVPDFLENLTPDEELKKLEPVKNGFFYARDRGTGRPTKKDRRDMEEFLDYD